MKKKKLNYVVGNIVNKIFIALFLVIGTFLLVTQFCVSDIIEVSATTVPEDTTVPVIEPVDDATINTKYASTWEEATATANDNKDGNISDKVEVTYFNADETIKLVDLEAARTELAAGRDVIVKYNVSDEAGNAADGVKSITAIDNIAPVITVILGSVNAEDAPNWEPVATAHDNKDGDIIDDMKWWVRYYKTDENTKIYLAKARTELVAGRDVIVKYIVYDNAMNTTEVTATFTAGVNSYQITYTVTGGEVSTENADTWTAPKAIVNDNVDGDISDDIVVTYYKADETSLTDLAAARAELKAGDLVVVKYNVPNNAENPAEISATFTALDNTAPIFAPVLNKIINPLEIETWIAPSTTASDNVDGILTDNITRKYFKSDGISTINLATARRELKAGRKVVVKYTVSDSAGNMATEVAGFRTNIEVQPKIINSKNVIYSSRFTLESNIPIKQYTIDNGVSWQTVTTANKKITITFPIIGEYRIIVKDEIGNESPVKVIRYLPKPSGDSNSKMPSINLEGATTITLKVGTDYSEPGYTATVADGTDITSSVEVNSNFNKDKIGSYTIVYKVTNNGQIKIITRVIKVIDTVGPQITLNGSAIIYVALNGVYDELGVEVFDHSQTETVVILGTANTNVEGTYTIIYKVKDIRKNESTATRTVIVANSATETITAAIGSGGQEITKEISSPLLGLAETEIMYLISELEPTIDSNWLTESEVAEIIPTKENSYLYILLMAEDGAHEIQQLDKLNTYEHIKTRDSSKVVYGINKKISTLSELIADVSKDGWIYNNNLIEVYKNNENSIIEFNNNSEISYQNVVVYYEIFENSDANGLSIIPSVKAAELTKGESFRVKVDSGQALKYYVEVKDTEIITSHTYYLSINANDNVFINTNTANNNLLLILGIIVGIAMLAIVGFAVAKKRQQ